MFLKINESLWNEFKQALGQIPMSLQSHQTVLNIIQQVENQCKQVKKVVN